MHKSIRTIVFLCSSARRIERVCTGNALLMYERVSVWAFVHEKAFWCRQGARRAVRLELPAAPSRRRGYIPAAVPSSKELSDFSCEEPLSSASLVILFLVDIPKNLEHLSIPPRRSAQLKGKVRLQEKRRAVEK